MSTISSISHVSSASHSLNQTAVAKAQVAAVKAQQKAQAIAAKEAKKAQAAAARAMLKEQKQAEKAAADAAKRAAAEAKKAEKREAAALKAAQPKRPVGRPRKAESVVSTSSKPTLVPIIPSPLSLPSPSLTQLMAEVAELRTHLAAQTAAFNAVSHKLETIRSALLA